MRQNAEHKSLKLSAFGAFFMSALGVGFGAFTGSEAILLDGLFSFTGFIIAAITLKVSGLISIPETKNYQFGLASLEPILNLTKGLVMLVLCAFAVSSSIQVILAGGRSLNGLWPFIYAVIAGVGCFALYFRIRHQATATGSPILKADSTNWLIDGIISGAVGVAFLVAYLIKDSSAKAFIPYLDSSIVLVLVLFVIKMPLGLVKDNFHQVLLGAPPKEEQDDIKKTVLSHLEGLNYLDHKFRIAKTGRFLGAIVHILLDKQSHYTVEATDSYRDKIHKDLKQSHPLVTVDIVFTQDKTLFY